MSVWTLGKIVVYMSFDPSISDAVRPAYEYFIFLGRVTSPSVKPPLLEDHFVSLSLASIPRNIRRHQETIEENRADTQMKFYKVVARPSLLYCSETWVTTKRDMTGLEAAEMCFVRSVTGYTGLDKIRSEVIRKELEISGI